MVNNKWKIVSTPYDNMFQAVKSVLEFEWSGFFSHFVELHRKLTVLDEAPRHDTMLSDDELKRVQGVSFCPYSITFETVNRELHLTQQALERALGAVSGMFAGELKVKLEDRLARHVRENLALQETFAESSKEHRDARQPFAIRRQRVGRAHYSMTGLIERMKQLKQIAVDNALSEFIPIFEDLIPRLYRMRSELAKCRDNPSQKMGRKSEQWSATMTHVEMQLTSISCKCQYEMLRLGSQFIGRTGSVTAMWVPSMEGADPWTFEYAPHMKRYWAAQRDEHREPSPQA